MPEPKIIGGGGHARQVRSECGERRVVAIGDNARRRTITRLDSYVGEVWEKAISPASIQTFCDIGDGTMVLAGALIGERARIGQHCILNHQCTVDHDALLEDYVHVAPGARVLGGAVVLEGALIGANAVVLPRSIVPAWAVVRAGSVWPADYEHLDGATRLGSGSRQLRLKYAKNKPSGHASAS